MTTPHLVHVFPAFATGGPEVRTTVLLNALAGEFRNTIIALNGDTSGGERLNPDANVRFVPAPTPGRSGHMITLARSLRELSPDLLLTYGWGGVDAIAAGRLAGRKRIVHMEDGFLPDEALKQKFKRLMARRFLMRAANWLVCPSQTLVTIARKKWWLPQKCIRFLPNGVDTEMFTPGSTADARRRLNLPADDLIIGTVGHLRAEKNQERLLRAFAKLSTTQPARLLFVGGGPLREHLSRLAVDLGVADRVHFPGVIQQPVDWYRAMDLFALSSDTEQMPIALLEAMACGLPVVATSVGDVASMVSADNKLFVTMLGDEGAFLRALQKLCTDGELRTKLATANRQRCVQEFSLTQMITAYRQMYTEGAGIAPEMVGTTV
ncbi:glycosyltransferase family 4 protein [soil metagenome]